MHLCLCIVCEGSGRSERTGRNNYSSHNAIGDAEYIGKERAGDFSASIDGRERRKGKAENR